MKMSAIFNCIMSLGLTFSGSGMIVDRVLSPSWMPAGVLPYAYKNGVPHVLLGLEKQFNKGKCIGYMWADCGGKADACQAPVKTALSEFQQESLYLWLDDITEGTLITTAQAGRVIFNDYAMFVSEVPYVCSSVMNNFVLDALILGQQTSRIGADGTAQACSQLLDHAEKFRFVWVPVEELVNCFDIHGSVKQLADHLDLVVVIGGKRAIIRPELCTTIEHDLLSGKNSVLRTLATYNIVAVHQPLSGEQIHDRVRKAWDVQLDFHASRPLHKQLTLQQPVLAFS